MEHQADPLFAHPSVVLIIIRRLSAPLQKLSKRIYTAPFELAVSSIGTPDLIPP